MVKKRSGKLCYILRINIKNQLFLSISPAHLQNEFLLGKRRKKVELEKTCLFFHESWLYILLFLIQNLHYYLSLIPFIPFDKNLTLASAAAAAMISTSLPRTQIRVMLTQQCDFWRLSRRKKT